MLHAVLVPLLSLSMMASAPPEGVPQPRVLPPTVEYCGHLAARLAVLPASRSEPLRSLGAEGMRLCDNGHVTTGVAKLRRAIRAAISNP